MIHRRTVIALGLSLGAHALLACLLLLFPARPVRTHGTSRRASGPALCLRVQGWDAPRRVDRPIKRAPERSREHYIPASVAPGVGIAPVLAPVGAAEGGRDSKGTAAPPGEGGLLSTPGTVRRVVYVVDRSLSMGLSAGLERARAELNVALRQLPPDAMFQVLLYNLSAEPLLPRGLSGLALADPDTIAQALQRLEEVAASGRTNHVAALRAGLNLRPEVLFFVTDADELTDADVQAITRMNHGGTTLHVIELARRRTESEGPLSRLARLNRGTYRRVAPPE